MKSAKAAIRCHQENRLVPARRERREKDELAFLPAALEIVETPPSPIGRAIGCDHHCALLSGADLGGFRPCRYCRVCIRARSCPAAASS